MNDATRPVPVRRASARPDVDGRISQSRALVPRWLARRSSPAIFEIGVVGAAVIILAALAQVAVPIPGSPVPVTGQSFGVVFLALLMGWARAGAFAAVYLAIGMAGVPVFAGGGDGPDVGTGFGYLAGMAVAAVVTGRLADAGAASSLGKSTMAAVLATLIIFLFGAAGLLLFLPPAALFAAGVQPFLPGAAVKIVLAAGIAHGLDRRFGDRLDEAGP